MRIILMVLILISITAQSRGQKSETKLDKKIIETIQNLIQANVPLGSFLEEFPLEEHAKIIANDDEIPYSSGHNRIDTRLHFTDRLCNNLGKVEEVEAVFRKYNRNIFYIVDFVLPHFKKVLKYGIKQKKKGNLRGWYNAKRYLVNYSLQRFVDVNPLYNMISSGTSYCYSNKESCWRYGIWAITDNDIKTTAVVNKDKFSLKLMPGGELKIFNGNGRSERLYYKNARIKKMEGRTKNGKKVVFFFKDKFGWSTIKVPEWIKEQVELKITEVYPGTKYKDLCISEIWMDTWKRTPDMMKQYKMMEELRRED